MKQSKKTKLYKDDGNLSDGKYKKAISLINKKMKLFALWSIRVFSDGLTTINERAKKNFEENEKAIIVDLGVGDATLLKYLVKNTKSKNLYGVDINDCIVNNICKYVKADLEKKFPFDNESVDVVISSQNIEHIIDVPNYCAEVNRILKLNGYVIVLTENLSSWVNIIALLFGWLPFSMTNVFGQPIGNPLIWHQKASNIMNKNSGLKTAYKNKWWGCLGHQRILTIRTYVDLFNKHGFKIEKVFTGGYGFMFGWLQKIMSVVDKTHSHFIGFKIRKIANVENDWLKGF